MAGPDSVWVAMRIRIISLLAVFPVFAASAVEPISVSGLKEGESLEIRYSSHGCFHSMTELIEISGGTVKFSELKMKWDDEAKKEIEVERKADGVLKLEKGDDAKLDKLLEFYASGPGGGCTTVDTIMIRHLRNGKCVRSELYEDGSCGTYEMDGVLTLPVLMAKRVKAG
jgi:hypothetical protein